MQSVVSGAFILCCFFISLLFSLALTNVSWLP